MWSRSLRIKAAELFEAGHGYKAVSTELEVNRETVRDWYINWRAIGTEAFTAERNSKQPVYPPELKLAAVHDRLKGMDVVDVMAKYQIPNRHCIKEWIKIYKSKGEEAFRCKSQKT